MNPIKEYLNLSLDCINFNTLSQKNRERVYASYFFDTFLNGYAYNSVMETSYSSLKQKEVVNIKDGKKLGKVCDVVFTFPEGKVLGIVAPNGWGFFRPGLFIDIRNIVKIGEDTVLVEIRPTPKNNQQKRGHGYVECCDSEDLPPPSKPSPRSYEEDE